MNETFLLFLIVSQRKFYIEFLCVEKQNLDFLFLLTFWFLLSCSLRLFICTPHTYYAYIYILSFSSFLLLFFIFLDFHKTHRFVHIFCILLSVCLNGMENIQTRNETAMRHLLYKWSLGVFFYSSKFFFL